MKSMRYKTLETFFCAEEFLQYEPQYYIVESSMMFHCETNGLMAMVRINSLIGKNMSTNTGNILSIIGQA